MPNRNRFCTLTNSCINGTKMWTTTANEKCAEKTKQHDAIDLQNPSIFAVATMFKMQFIVYYIMIYAFRYVKLHKPDTALSSWRSTERSLQIRIDKLIGFNNRINLNLTLSNAYNEPVVTLTAHSLSHRQMENRICNRVSAVFSISCINDFRFKTYVSGFLFCSATNQKKLKTSKYQITSHSNAHISPSIHSDVPKRRKKRCIIFAFLKCRTTINFSSTLLKFL